MLYCKQLEVMTMKIINKSEFDSVIAQGVVLVDFFATWCGPCKMLSPVLEEVAKEVEGKLDIVKVDVNQDSELAMRFGIMSVPTMIIFKDGQPMTQLQGFMPKAQLMNELKKVI